MYDKIEIASEIYLECKKEAFQTVFNDIKNDDFDYLGGYDNEFGLYMLYEALIYFMSNEDYEKCALIKAKLDSFYENKKYYIPI
jgi:hypothetical protein